MYCFITLIVYFCVIGDVFCLPEFSILNNRIGELLIESYADCVSCHLFAVVTMFLFLYFHL